MFFPLTNDGTRIEVYAEVVGSNLTEFTSFILVNYGIVLSSFLVNVGHNAWQFLII
jgi:hypothetical protein